MSGSIIPAKPFKDEDLSSPAVSKRALLTFVSENGDLEFLKASGLSGKVDDIIRDLHKDKIIQAYKDLYTNKSFKKASVEVAKEAVVSPNDAPILVSEKKEKEPILYSKQQMKKGDKVNFPHKGDTVHCWYTGTLENGTVFDSNTGAGKTKKPKQPLSFKVGVGRVIRGWDEALLTMSKGEKSKITIEPEWAYGKKGLPSAGIPPNSRLIFEMPLIVKWQTKASQSEAFSEEKG